MASILTTSPKTKWVKCVTSPRARRLGREFIWIGMGQAAAVMGALVGVRLLTGILSLKEYGLLALGMTVATLVDQVATGPLSSGTTRFFASARDAGALRGYLADVRTLVVQATGIVLLAVAVLCGGLALAGQGRWIGLSLAAVCFALLSGCNSVLNGMQNAARQRAIVALHQGLASWGRFLLAAAILSRLGGGSATALLGYALAILMVLISQSWFLHHTLSAEIGARAIGRIDPGWWRAKILSYAWPFVVWGVPGWMQLASDRWTLQAFSSTEDVGRYAVLYQLGYYPILIVGGLIVQLVYPISFQRAGDASDPSRLRRAYDLGGQLTKAALVLTGIAVALACSLHGLIFRFLAGAEYRTVSWMLPCVVLAGGLFASSQLATVSLLTEARTRRLILPKVGTAIVGVFLNVLGAACYGMLGVVVATAVTAATHLIWISWLVRIGRSHTRAE